MKYTLTCNDCIKTMERENITVAAETLDEAWEKAREKFARKYKTRKEYVNITATHRND